MTGTERIREKILQDAKMTAAAVLEAGRREADVIRVEAETRRRESSLETKQRIDAGFVALEQRNGATLQLEIRKQMLAARQQMVDEAFLQAAKAVADLPDETYRELLTAMILATTWQGDAELVVSARDRERLGSGFPEEIDLIRHHGNLAGFTRYASDSLPVHGGFVMRRGEMEINGTLAVVVAGIHPKLERRVAEILFGEFR